MAQIKDLPARSWTLLLEKWIEHIPSEMETFDQQATVQYLLNLNGRDLVDKGVIDLVGTLRESVFSSAVFLHHKAKYCILAAKHLNSAGFPTWATLLMYDACFFSAKTVCYLLGIADAGRDSSFYLDIFYQEQGKRRLVDLGHQAFKLKERMSHSMLWEVFPRLMNTLKAEEKLVDNVKLFRRTDYSKFSRERNRILYSCMSWSREDRIKDSDLFERTAYNNNLDFFNSPDLIGSEYFHEYNFGALAIFNFSMILFNQIGERVPLVRTLLDDDQSIPKLPGFYWNN